MSEETKELKIAQATERPIGGKPDAAYPGHINVGGGFFEGHYPGNKLKIFTGGLVAIETELNAFFEAETGAVVTGVWPLGDSAIAVIYTRMISQEEIEGIQKFSAEIRKKLDAEAAKKAELEFELERRRQEAEKETQRLAELGRKCEQNHPKKGAK